MACAVAQPNKAIIGRNAHAHEAGIHQTVCWKRGNLWNYFSGTGRVYRLNRYSLKTSKEGIKDKVKSLMLSWLKKNCHLHLKSFKELTDHKKEVTDDDLYSIIMEIKTDASNIEIVRAENFEVNYEQDGQTEHIDVVTPAGKQISHEVTGSGSVEALYKAIQEILAETTNLLDLPLSSVGGGKDALAESVQLILMASSLWRGTAQDVLAASANAYINAVNRYLMSEQAVTATESVNAYKGESAMKNI